VSRQGACIFTRARARCACRTRGTRRTRRVARRAKGPACLRASLFVGRVLQLRHSAFVETLTLDERCPHAAFVSHSAMTSRSRAWSVILRRFAHRSRSRHIASENRIDRGDDPSGCTPFLGRPRCARSSALALRSPTAPRPSTCALVKSTSGISRSDAALGSLLVFFIALSFGFRCPSGGSDPGLFERDPVLSAIARRPAGPNRRRPWTPEISITDYRPASTPRCTRSDAPRLPPTLETGCPRKRVFQACAQRAHRTQT